ncbi:gelsolin-like isoform X2 [Plodia interpunctella]|nr:gelsolin-like isoform X2 [Plodia interpunctella]XP_053622404.1 gelsolin-like isoform X2 [Plodia interpunctella]
MPEVHVAFESSGRKPGLEIWRIEDFEPVLVPKQQYGNFYSGDSYIVLNTSGDSPNLNWDIHFWLGNNTSQDEAGTAAILTVNLDDNQFSGAAVQHRETQGYESKQFLDYFPPAIRYLDGGHASGFSHVTINAGSEKRLFQIKGNRNVRVRQVEASVSSMNKGDCFILDVDHDIFVFVGQNSKNKERIKAISVANQIRDQDHNGRGNVEIIDPFSDGHDTANFFSALGSGDLDSVAEASAGGDDEEFERGDVKEVTLSEISDNSGSMKITKLPSPVKREQLNSKECYVLDTGSSGIFVWVGRQSNEKEKAEAMNRAQQYLKAHNLPPWVHVSKVPEGLEPTAFKQYFEDWN